MTKEFLLRLPEEIAEIIEDFKTKSGVSKTNFIKNAIYWYCVKERLISFNYLRCVEKDMESEKHE